MSQIEIVPWDTEKNSFLLPLFSEVFQKQVSLKELEIKYSEGESRRLPIAHLALVGSKAVGFFCLIPTRFELEGKTYWGGHSVDTMVLPAYRKDGLFGKLMHSSIMAAQDAGLDFLYGCGVDAAIPSFLKKGWELMYRMQMLMAPAANWPKYQLLKRLGMAPDLGLVSHPPTQVSKNGLSAVHDPDFYKWKLKLNPSTWHEFQNGWVWLRAERNLWLGDIQLKGEFMPLWEEVQVFARNKGFRNVIFQASPSFFQEQNLPDGIQFQDTWQTLIYRFPNSPDLSRLQLVFGDVDVF